MKMPRNKTFKGIRIEGSDRGEKWDAALSYMR